jgi:diguanylate cyclase (GGDEF)-like protein
MCWTVEVTLAVALLLAALLVVLAAWLWSNASLRRRYRRLESLHGFATTVGEQAGGAPAATAVLEQARALIGADRCELTILGSKDRGRRTCMGRDGRVSTEVVRLPPDSLERRVASSGRTLLVRAGPRDPSLARLLEAAGARDAIVAPVRGEDGTVGTLMVADRASGTFTPADRRLFEALAAQASVALLKERLEAQLRQEAAEREHRALHDALTGLPNRTLFSDLVDGAAAASGGASVAVLLVDLDRFKEVNETLGHRTGDALLREASSRLLRALGGRGMLARVAGDEFGVLLPRVDGPEQPSRVAEDLKSSVSRPFALEGLTFEIGASVGIALHPAHGSDAATLLQRADVAMCAAKRTPGETQLYSPEQDHHTPRRLALVGELRKAIEARELKVHFQPIVALDSGEVVGVEALLRWPHPRYGFLAPEEFVPIAEQTDLIRPLTDLVLGTSLEQCAAWRSRGLDLRMAVNLSARSLLDESLPGRIGATLQETGVPAHLLTLELTEGSIVSDPDGTAGCLGLLSAMGVSLSVDDFGTGYSSLSYLRHLPVDEVKIDKSFVLHMSTDATDAVIVRSTVNLARSLGLRVLAEGVEDRATWERLRSLGCDLAQGYLISRALPAPRLETWLRDRSRWPAEPEARDVSRHGTAPGGRGYLRVAGDGHEA